jgi:hypothetical protein
MGFLWLSVAYLWLTYVLARFPLTEPLGDRLGDFLSTCWRPSARVSSSASAVADHGGGHPVHDQGRQRRHRQLLPGAKGRPRAGAWACTPDTVSATHRLVTVIVWGLGIAIAYPFIPMSNSDAFKGCR